MRVDSAIIEFVDDDAAYLAWLAGHPTGFVLNVRRKPDSTYVVLHRASCGTIAMARRSGAYTGGSYRKICSDQLAELRQAAVAEGRLDGSFSARCGHCDPQ